MAKKRKKNVKIISAIVFIVALVGALFLAFAGENFVIVQELFKPNVSKEEIREALSGLGYRGYLAFGILSMLQVVLTVIPAEPIQVMAGLSFGVLRGAAICTIGLFAGNTLVYILYKIYGDKLEEFFEKNAEFDFEAASRSPKIALVVLLLNLLPAIPYGIICFFAASLNIKYPKYILLTTLGALPSIFLDVALGHVAIATSWIFSILVLLVLITLLIILYRKKALVFKAVNDFMKKRSMPYSSKTKVKKANRFIYGAATFGGRFLFDTRIKIRMKNEVGRLDKPSIVLCNHGSFIDFVYSSRIIKKERPNFVAARLYFYHKALGNLLKEVGCFPKSMFSSDVENAKNCMRVLSQGGTIAMMPEARLSTAGKYEGVQEPTYKFIQRMGVAVYVIQQRGDYLARPKWGDKIRRGALVEVSLRPLFAAGETKTLSLEEVKKRVDEALYYNEFEWLESKPDLQYKSKTLAVGLENVLTLCPECKAKHSFQTQGRKITCEKCGFTRTLNSRYGFDEPPFKNILEWYEYQTDEMEKAMREDPDYALQANVVLKHASKDGKTMLYEAGTGVCTLDKTGLCYRGTEDGKEIVKTFPLSDIYRLLFGAGEDFEIYEGEEIYYFVPEDKRGCVDWYIASGVLKKIYE
ncbi:MAG: VTT domain-containing protein [Clostridia bacterium]|nr:VTT domain-containing protein [Clostridia bacterium]